MVMRTPVDTMNNTNELARETTFNDMGRGAYDTTGTPKPPPPPMQRSLSMILVVALLSVQRGT